MKTAEQFYNERVGRGDMGWMVELNTNEYFAHVKEIQLDAMKEGMRKAAAISEKDYSSGGSRIQQVILTTAEQLTEKDIQ